MSGSISDGYQRVSEEVEKSWEFRAERAWGKLVHVFGEDAAKLSPELEQIHYALEGKDEDEIALAKLTFESYENK